MMSVYEQIVELLESHSISYELHEHVPVRTVAEVEEKLPFLLDKMLKTVAFRVKDGRFILAGLRGHDRIDYRQLAAYCGVNRRAIASMADCEYAWKVLEGLKVQMDRVRYLSMPLATPVDTLIAQHERVYQAIAAHTPDEAEKAMRLHLSEILKSLPHIVRSHEDMFTD